MPYILDRHINILKYQDSQAFILDHFFGKMEPISLQEYELLKQCDGETQLPDSELTEKLEKALYIYRCKPGEEHLDPAQIKEYDNRLYKLLEWTITERCNYNCLHCYHAADNQMPREEYTWEQAVRAMDDMRSCGILAITLTGGEPFMYPHLREIIRELYNRNIQVQSIVTNGSLLTEEWLAYIKSMFPKVEMRISFDGVGFHDWMRNHKGSEEQALRAFRLCHEMGLNTRANMNVNRRNRSSIWDSVKILNEIGLDRIRIIKTTEVPRWQMNAGDDSMPIEEYYDFCLELAEKYRSSDVSVPILLWQCLYMNASRKTFSCLPVKTCADQYTGQECLCTTWSIRPALMANGELLPCSPLAGICSSRGISFGNAKVEGLKKLLTQDGPYILETSRTSSEKIAANPKCTDCPWAKGCQGGCPTISTIFGGSFLSCDPFKCAFFEKGYYDRFCAILNGWSNITPLY